jgi:formamidopyrimidine-DNA glycosylase
LRKVPLPRVAGRKIADVVRSGKRVLIRFAEGNTRNPLWLAVHLRMTGRLICHDGIRPDRRHLRARFILDRGELWFVDTRRFGTFGWYASEVETAPGGVDPTGPECTAARLAELLDDSRQPIKPWLLRQDRLVGLGNIYASEILFACGISPSRPAGSLGSAEIGRLHRHTRRILRRAIENCGTTFSDFQDSRGVEGSYQQYLRVYDRDGERCRRCGSTIARIVQAQRSTFHCSGCQH